MKCRQVVCISSGVSPVRETRLKYWFMSKKVNWYAVRVALIYIGVAAGWILFSDELVKRLVGDPDLRVKIEIFKGWAFVLATGGVLYVMMRNLIARWEMELRQREQTEAELEKARAHYQYLLRTSSDGIHVLNQRGDLLEANATFYRMLGYPVENPPTLNVADWDAKFNGQALQDLLRENLEHQKMFETLHRCSDGRIIEVEINASPIEIDGRRCIYASSRDIGARKLAETALRENEQKFARMFQSSPLPVTLSSLNEGRYLDVNEEFLKLVQRPRNEVIGRTATEIGVWADPAQRPAVIAEIKERGYLRNVDLVIRTGTGEPRHIVWSAEVVLIRGEQCLLGTSLDITERKTAEQKMRESEERYRQLFDLESDALILVDCETRRFVDVNQSAQRLYGYSREEFLALTLEQISDDPAQTRASINIGDGFIPLRWHHKKNGERFAVEITANIISHQGRRTKLAAVRDITSRQRVMEMLSETTDQLLEAQRIAGLGSYVFEISTGRWTSSEVLDQIFGLSEPGMPHDIQTWVDLVHPQDRTQMTNYLNNEVIKKNSSFDRTYRIIRPNDGQIRWVHGLGKLILNTEGTAVRMVGVIQDITEHQQAEERIRVQASAMAAAANAIVITNRDGIIEWVNPAFTKLTGFTPEEAIGKNPRILKSGQHPPAFYANLWATVLTGNVWHNEVINRRKDGQLYTENVTITPVRGADGQVTHFVAVKQDVTDQRQLEKRMQQAQKMEAIGTLAGGIAHDFNNILAAMFGYAYLLQQDTAGNVAAQENIAEILKATGRAKDLVQQILTFSRQRDQKPQIIRLDTIIKEAIKFLRASLPAQIKIEMTLDDETPSVLADATQIYQVVINLATNALHAMEGRPGMLSIMLEPFQPDTKFIHLHPDFRRATYARLTVADTGHGMDAKTLERIFEPFFTTKPVGKGTGLGLAVVHGIVESHQGAITVESAVGEGTRFQLFFPGQARELSFPTAVENHVPSGRGQNILLLDDEPALTGALQRLLVRLNYRVSTSNNPRETLQIYRNNPAQFDLVITDLTMPEMNGLEVARQLRSLRPDLPIILASGFSSDLSRENLEANGICDLLEKPISRTALAEVVHRALANHDGHSHHLATNGTPHPGF